MFDTDIINGERVAFIEPKSLVHEVLSFIAAQKLMAILCSDQEETIWGIEKDPSYVLAKEVSREFDVNRLGFEWLTASNILINQMSLRIKPGMDRNRCYELYLRISKYGEEVLDELENGKEVKLYLD